MEIKRVALAEDAEEIKVNARKASNKACNFRSNHFSLGGK
jgi:hypothetical protein